MLGKVNREGNKFAQKLARSNTLDSSDFVILSAQLRPAYMLEVASCNCKS
jgi:hypothetical protein